MTEQVLTDQMISSMSAGSLKEETTVSRHIFLRQHFSANKMKLASVIFLGLISSCTGFFLTLIIGDFFMLQFETGSSKGKLLAWMGIKLSSTNGFFLLFALLILVKMISSYAETYSSVKQGELFAKIIREKLFSVQMRSNAALFANRTYGKYLLRYSNDMKAMQHYLVKGVLGSIRDLLFVLLGLLILLKISTSITFVLLFLYFATSILSVFLWQRQKKYIVISRSKRSGLLAFVTKSFARFSTLQRDEKEAYTVDRFHERSAQLYHANLANGKLESLLQSVMPALQYVVIGTVLLMIQTGAAQVSASDGLIIILILMLMQGALRRLLKVPGILNKGRVSLDKINDLIILSRNSTSSVNPLPVKE